MTVLPLESRLYTNSFVNENGRYLPGNNSVVRIHSKTHFHTRQQAKFIIVIYFHKDNIECYCVDLQV